jgi:hypothetical protein
MTALDTEIALEDFVWEKANVPLHQCAVLMKTYRDLDVILHLEDNNVRVLEHVVQTDFVKALVTAQILFSAQSMKLLTKLVLTNVLTQPSVQVKGNVQTVTARVSVNAE